MLLVLLYFDFLSSKFPKDAPALVHWLITRDRSSMCPFFDTKSLFEKESDTSQSIMSGVTYLQLGNCKDRITILNYKYKSSTNGTSSSLFMRRKKGMKMPKIRTKSCNCLIITHSHIFIFNCIDKIAKQSNFECK